MNDLSFIITTYEDFPRLERLCKELLSVGYAPEKISVLSDGDKNKEIWRLCRKNGLHYHYFENSYSLSSGFRFWRNVFEVFDKNKSEFLIKLDTDVKVNRYLQESLSPDFDNSMFGTLCGKKIEQISFIQNGVRGFHKSVIENIKNSPLYEDDEFFSEAFSKSQRFNSTKRLERGLISTEFTMWKLASIMSLKLKNHPAICSYWKRPEGEVFYGDNQFVSKENFEKLSLNAAFVHPFLDEK